MRGALLGIVLVVALAAPAIAGEEPVHVSYVGGSHTLTGSIHNMPVLGELPVSTAVAVCQQHVQPIFVAVKVDTPGIGGACGVPLPGNPVVVTVQDAIQGAIGFEYRPLDLDGNPCGDLGTAASGEVLALPSNCGYLSIWPVVQATYGTITVAAA